MFLEMFAVLLLGCLFVCASGDEESGIDIASALLAVDSSGSSSSSTSGSSGTSGGRASLWEQLFGADAAAFGGQGGNPFSDSFLTSAASDIGLENMGLLALMHSMNSQNTASSQIDSGATTGSGTSVAGTGSTSVHGAIGAAIGGHSAVNTGLTTSVAGHGIPNVGGGDMTRGEMWHTFGRDSGGAGGAAHSGAFRGGSANSFGVARSGSAGGVGFGGGFVGGFGGGAGVGEGTVVGLGSGGIGQRFDSRTGSGFLDTGSGSVFGARFGGGVGAGIGSGVTAGFGGDLRTDLKGGISRGRDGFRSLNFIGPDMESNLASASTNAILSRLVLGTLASGNQQSINSNINVNALISSLMEARHDRMAFMDFIRDSKMRDRLTNEQNIARIISILQNFQTKSNQAPIVVGLESSGKISGSSGGQNSLSALLGIQNQVSPQAGGRGRPMRIKRVEPPAKEINLNIVVKQDKSSSQLSGGDISGIGFPGDNGFLGTENREISRSDFSHSGFVSNNEGGKGPARFSFKNPSAEQHSFGGSVDLQSAFWKDSPSSALMRPIPNNIAEKQLAHLMQGTNRGDIWQRLSADKGAAISAASKQQGFLSNDNFMNALNPGTQFEHSRQIIAYPKGSDPIFNVPHGKGTNKG